MFGGFLLEINVPGWESNVSSGKFLESAMICGKPCDLLLLCFVETKVSTQRFLVSYADELYEIAD